MIPMRQSVVSQKIILVFWDSKYLLISSIMSNCLQLIFVLGMRGQSTLLQREICLLSCVLSSMNPLLELLHEILSYPQLRQLELQV